MDFRSVSMVELAGRVARAEVSAVELAEASLARIDALDGTIRAFVAVDAERALAEAAAIDRHVAAGDDVGPLAGIPIGVKDTEDAIGHSTTYGSALFADSTAAETDSILVARLREAGCVVIGKTNTPELAQRADTDNPIFGRTANPWATDRSPGGSSGGSAAAVAAGLVPLATGSDGGGSLRIPAALCGLSTIKCSLGRVPAGGVEPPAWADLSSKGVMTRTISDTAYALDAIIGPDPTDLRSLPLPEASWAEGLDDAGLPKRVLWSRNLGYGTVDREIAQVTEGAVAAIAAAGVDVIEIDGPFDEDPVMDWLALSVTANRRTVDAIDPRGERWDELDPALVFLMRALEGRVGAADVLGAQDVAHRLNLRLVEAFHRAPLLLAPVTAGRTPMAGRDGTIDGVEDPNWVRFTYPFNLTRSPAGSVVAGFDSTGMPVGLQVVGPQHGDVAVLRAIRAIERTLDLDTRCPIEPPAP